MVVVWLLLSLMAGLTCACFYASNFVVHYKNRHDPNRWVDNAQYYETCEKQTFIVTSGGLNIACKYLPCPQNPESKKVAVLAHGVTATHMSVVDYVPMFHKAGYHTLLYDQPSHGESEGKYRTYGFIEKQVLKDLADYAVAELGANTYGLWGISMGAAAVLMAAPDCAPVFVIADCPYDDFIIQFQNQIYSFSHIPAVFAHVFTRIVSAFNKLRFGWSFGDCAPIKHIDEIAAPVLLIHGTKDGFVRKEMSMRMFDKRADCGLPVHLELFESGHAASFYSDKETYRQIVWRFIADSERQCNQPAS